MQGRLRVATTLLLLVASTAAAAQTGPPASADANTTQSPDLGTHAGQPVPSNPADAAPAAAAASSVDAPDDLWVPGTNRWGARGVWLLDAAHAARKNSLVFAASHEMSIANSLFAPTDYNFYQTQRLYVLWSPLQGFELGLSEGLVTNQYRTFVQHTIQALGSPALNVKYSLPIAPDLGVGILGNVVIPSAIHSNGLVPHAFTAAVTLLGTYQMARWIEATLNVGYVLDESGKLSSNIEPDQRLAFNISNSSGVLYGLGAVGRIDLADVVGLGPFAEITGRFNTGVSFAHNPLQVAAGLKAYWLENHFVELLVGVTPRLAGAPNSAVALPGLPPWGLFAQVSLHLFDHPEPKQIIMGPPPCDIDTDCAQGQTCHDHICIITERVVEQIVTQQETFTLSGRVLDAQTSRPVLDSVVSISGFEKTPLQVDYKTGAYHSFPVPCGDGLIQVRATAPNYKVNVQALPRGQANEDKSVMISMVRDDRPAMGKLKGSIKDARTGKPIAHGTVFVIALQQKITADERGNFVADVRAGRYDVLVSAPKYATQRKKLIIRDTDVIIINVDLRRGRPSSNE